MHTWDVLKEVAKAAGLTEHRVILSRNLRPRLQRIVVALRKRKPRDLVAGKVGS
jgi:hypothetical protein